MKQRVQTYYATFFSSGGVVKQRAVEALRDGSKNSTKGLKDAAAARGEVERAGVKKSALKNAIAKKKRQGRVAFERSDKKRCYKMGSSARRRWSGSSAST